MRDATATEQQVRAAAMAAGCRFHVDVLALTTRLELGDGSAISCGSVILARGVSYRTSIGSEHPN